MIPTFVVHYDKLTDRKKNIQKVFNFAQFITEPQISDLKDAENHNFYKYRNSPELWKERTQDLYSEKIPFRELKPGDISCFLKHLKALELAQSYSTPSLILEDDAIPDINIWKAINESLLRHVAVSWDVLLIGGAFDHNITRTIYEITNNIVVKNHPATNTVCAYMVKPEVATRILHKISSNKNGYVLPIDFEYNYIFKELRLRVAHYIPYPIREGSSSGFYKGTQER